MKSVKLKKIIAGAIVASIIPVMLQSGVNAELKQSADNGNWSYVNDSGVATNWKLIDGIWYNFDSSGVMKTGWVNDKGTWYFTDASGAMQTGKVIIDNKEYNFSNDGDAVGEIPKAVKAFDNKGVGVTK